MATTSPQAGYVRASPKALWWLSVTYAAAAAGAYLLFVRSGIGQRLDEAGFIGGKVVRRGLVGDAESLLGGIEVTVLLIALGAIGLLAMWRGRAQLATVVLAVVVGSNLTTQVLKHSVLERPHLISDAFRLPNSFPSGHVTAIASLAIAAVLVMPRRLRPATALVGTVAALVVGFATVAAGWHRSSDVIGAWLVVGTWSALAAATMVAGGRSGPPRPAGRASAALETGLWVIGGAAMALFVATGAAWMSLHWIEATDAGRDGLAVTSAVSGMVGTALVVSMSIVAATRRYSLAPGWLGPR